MRKNLFNLFGLLSVVMAVLVFTGVSNAQPRNARGRNYNKAEVNRIINNLETRLDRFKNDFDTSLDKSRLNGSNREDYLNRRASDLERATDELRNEFNRRDAWNENKDEVRKCLNIARDINKTVRNRRLGGKTESNWSAVRYELNTLAKIYNLQTI